MSSKPWDQIIQYNLLFIVVFAIWFNRHRIQIPRQAKKIPLPLFWLITLCLSGLGLYATLTFFGSDVGIAVTGSVEAFVNDGANPYVDPVVPHLLDDGTKVYSVYHYSPIDLFTYSLFYIIISFFSFTIPELQNYWFFIANLVLMTVNLFLIWKIVGKEDSYIMPFGFFFSSILLMNNATLMLTLFLSGYYFYEIKQRNNMKIFFWTLAASVKYVTGLFIVQEFIDSSKTTLQEGDLISFNSWRFVLSYLISGFVLILICLPFGLLEVFEATILYQGEISRREQVAATYGPLFIELIDFLGLKSFYFLFFVLIIAITPVFISTLSDWTPEDRQMLFGNIIMFCLPFFGTELYAGVTFYWLLIDFRKGTCPTIFDKREPTENASNNSIITKIKYFV